MKDQPPKKKHNAGQVQGEAFSRCCADMLELIARHASLFRDIVESYKLEHDGNLPTADQILWFASEMLKHDITKEQ